MEAVTGEILYRIALFTIIQSFYFKASTSILLFAIQTEKNQYLFFDY